jgi:hypothetical protein
VTAKQPVLSRTECLELEAREKSRRTRHPIDHAEIARLEKIGEGLLSEGLQRLAVAAREGTRVRLGVSFVTSARSCFERAARGRRGLSMRPRRR